MTMCSKTARLQKQKGLGNDNKLHAPSVTDANRSAIERYLAIGASSGKLCSHSDSPLDDPLIGFYRGTAHTCQIMIVGELTDTSADMSINTSSAAINAAKQTSQKRKRKMDGDIDLAARVEQLEHFLRMQQSAQNASFAHAAQLVSPGIQQTPAIDGSMRSTPSGISYVPPSIPQMLPTGRLTPSTSTKDVPVPKKNGVNGQSAVEEEEDAAAALGQLSKAVSKEGGTEARICESLS